MLGIFDDDDDDDDDGSECVGHVQFIYRDFTSLRERCPLNYTEEEIMEDVAATVVSATAHVITETKNDEARVISEAIHSLPAPLHVVVKDLLSIGVCVRCIFRLFGVYGKIYSCSWLSPSMLCSFLEEPNISHGLEVENGSKANEDSNNCLDLQESDAKSVFCSICLGILQFSYRQEKESLVRKGCVSDFTASVAEIIKQEGHGIGSFAFEILFPPITLANERAVWLYMKNKYGSELWFQGKFPSEPVSLKDALKLSITNSLETLLGVQFGVGSFHICLTYTHNKASLELPNSLEHEQDRKRRKTSVVQAENGKVDCAKGGEGSQFCVMEGAGPVNVAVEAASHWSVNSLQDKGFCVKEPCLLGIRCYRSPIYIGGRYLKYSRNVSQTRWIIDDERMGQASVEEINGDSILPVCRGDNYKFHAAGREDIDVRMLGSGRPFLIEVQNAHSIPCKVSIREMEERINNTEVKLVTVRNLKMVGNQGWTLMREGEAEKQKQYAALVWISRALEDADLQKISSLKDMQILQRTPVRVLHRRSPLERGKIIHWMEVENIAGSTQYFLLHLCTQAGTYIKEFVHGDLGRTHPRECLKKVTMSCNIY